MIDIIKTVLADTFYLNFGNTNTIKKCKTDFNFKKVKYISSNSLTTNRSSFDYLGYEFWLYRDINSKVCINYGITEEKRKKYIKRVRKIISYYNDPSSPDYNDLELLRHRIRAFTSREVYISKHFKTDVWKVKGFISNYGELRYLLDSGLVDDQTMDFLSNMINNCFNGCGLEQPYFLKTNGYNLLDNLKKNRTLLFVSSIGYDYKSLIDLCQSIGINTIETNGKRRGYGTLVRDYLIKVKVGY